MEATVHAAAKKIRERMALEREANLARWRRADADAKRIVQLCIDAGARRVLQWGSVVRPEDFRGYSDIDIGVEGMRDAESVFRLLEKAEAITRFPVHLVETDKLAPEFRESILARSRVVYEEH